MKRIPILLGLLLLGLSSFGQNPNWILPDDYIHYISTTSFSLPPLAQPATFCDDGINPNNPNYEFDGYDGQLPDFSSNLMSDAQGDPLFSIVDGVIYDGAGHYLNSLVSIAGCKGSSETVIVPDPADCNRYYLILARVNGFSKLPHVFLLDMSLPNENCNGCDSYGALVLQSCPGSSQLRYDLPVTCVESSFGQLVNSADKISNCHIAASELRPGNFRYVFISNTYGIYRFRIDAGGFSSDNLFIPFNTGTSPAFNPFNIRSEMELVTLPGGGLRLATPYRNNPATNPSGAWQYLYTVDFDASGNYLASTERRFPMFLYSPGGNDQSAAIKGIEFSENGDRIYVTHTTSPLNPDQMEYYNFSNPTVALVPFNISPGFDLRFSMLERTENDKLIAINQIGLYELPNSTTANGSDLSLMWGQSFSPTYEGQPGSNFHKLYLLPDQIDDMDYSQHFTVNLACCLASAQFEADRYTATSGTWSPGANPFGSAADIYIKEELRIPANVSLTLNNLNLRFAPGARLIIENGTSGQQGGRLTLNGTLLTVDERCTTDATWLGVEVWGNTGLSQGSLSNSTQGRLFVQGGSQIEHAQVGILVGKRFVDEISQGECPPILDVQPFSFDPTRNGGIVRGVDARFRNNQRGVWFQPYFASSGADNLSRFYTSEFYWDAPLKGGLGLQNHAHLNQVKGIYFYGCEFRNDAFNDFVYTGLGTGINSFRSQFHVREYCSALLPDPCTNCPDQVNSRFAHLRYGIQTNNPIDNLTFTVRKSDFEDCQYGMYVRYTHDGQIKYNDFQVLQASYQTAGIVLRSAPSFVVQENKIAGIGSAAGSSSYGIVVNNSGVLDNEIYKNTFENLHIAVQSESNNAVQITPTNYPGSNPFNMSGLNYTCNDYGSGIEQADMTVVNGRIDYFQGHAIGHSSTTEAVEGSARNRFSLHGESPALEHDITVTGTVVQELQYVGLNTSHYWVDSYSANWVLPLISSFTGTPVEATPGMCPTRCKTKFQKETLRASLQSEIRQIEETLITDPELGRAEREALEGRLRRLREQLNVLEGELISDALASYESLADLATELDGLGASAIADELADALGADMTKAIAEPDPEAPVAFLPLEGGPERKVAPYTRVAPVDIELEVFPNPTSGRFEVRFSAPGDAAMELLVVDLMGRNVLHQVTRGHRVTVEADHLPSGLYQLLLRRAGQTLGHQKVEIVH
ncbi:MAG: T9SS type A sorting domain-containing protein [Bacteroidota bacterium]